METINYKGYAIQISPDDSPESPREWLNIGTLVGFDKGHFMSEEGAPNDVIASSTDIWDAVYKLRKFYNEPCLVVYIRAYDHSGVSLMPSRFLATAEHLPYPFNDEFDSYWAGMIFVPFSKIRKAYCKKRLSQKTLEMATKALESEVELYNQYINGDVWCYNIVDSKCNSIDSCCGLYGHDETVQYAKHLVDLEEPKQLELDLAQ